MPELFLAPVSQLYDPPEIVDPLQALQAGLDQLPLHAMIRPGMRVAIGLGSRGISCLQPVVVDLIRALKKCGAEPFVVPAMGSHGGSTAHGQIQVLEGYGLGEKDLGIPVISSVETVLLGHTANEMPVYFDAQAAKADAIVVVNRIKEHTAFRGPQESGLMKMLAVGLGKPKGANEIHQWGVGKAMPEAAKLILAKMPVLFGVAIVENRHHQPARLEVVPSVEIVEREPALLKLARQLTPKIPFDDLDLLIVHTIGKDLAGTGMDLNVIGMWRRTGGIPQPDYRMIAAFNLTPKSHGNAIGIGYADLITRRLRDAMDPQATYRNCITSRNYNGAKIPITLENDQEVVNMALSITRSSDCRVVMVENTLSLDVLWVSEAVLQEVQQGSRPLKQIGPLKLMQFDEAGKLVMENWTPIPQ
jgi:Domain of unknown function (DUF362)